MNLVASLSLMCIFLPAFWPWSAQSLVLSACEAQHLPVVGFPEERLPCSRNSLDVAKNGQTNLVPISGRVPVLNLEISHGQSGVQPTVENLPKDRHGSDGFCGGFLVAKYKRKIRRKNPPENPPAENTKSAGARPPRNPPARPKNLPQNLSTNPPVKPPSTRPVFSIEKDRSWRRHQSMDSGTFFGCLLGMVEAPMLKCTCNPSAAAGGVDKACCAPFQTTL